VTKELKLNVKVPPGIENGTRIRYAGEGDAGRSNGPRGDLYVVLSIRPHDFFERDGQNLHCVIPISFPQAALGAEIEIPAIGGNVTIKIPEGTQSGKLLHARGKGIPFLNESGRGDLIVQVLVQVPRKLSRTQRELVNKLAESLAVDNKPTSPSLMEKMKDLFN
jgi:molecular chaperone DnaJ